jgi:TM2 domain-containing membrane protein YozV
VKRSTKAMLLSGLIFPGAGHFYLKRWIEGILLSGAAACALYFIVSVALNTALDIAGQIESGAVAADVGAITERVAQQLQATEGATNLATIILTVCWVMGIVGSYWQGREK